MALIITIILLLTLYITINSIRKTYMQNKQAKQLGIEVVTEDEFFKILKN